MRGPLNYREPDCCLNCRYGRVNPVEVTGVSAFGVCAKIYTDKRGRPHSRNVNVALFGRCDDYENRHSTQEKTDEE